jgi:hypothetical protein
MTTNYVVCASWCRVPYCCGLLEIGAMAERHTKEGWMFNPYSSISSWEDAWKALIKTAGAQVARAYFPEAENPPLLFNFVQQYNGHEFEAPTLRQMLIDGKLGEAIKIYSWVNPNTRNTIESWLLKNGSTEVV